ncbi:hypothetical protein PENSPDRAFT_750024 [Peniophora sp. CONT]|nr:hypothetical protein PENSPDRAFT_750024 [Peniophora sp. CONT]
MSDRSTSSNEKDRDAVGEGCTDPELTASEERPAKRMKATHDRTSPSVVKNGESSGSGRTSARPRVPALPRIPRSIAPPPSNHKAPTAPFIGSPLTESTAIQAISDLSKALDTQPTITSLSQQPASATSSQLDSGVETTPNVDLQTLEKKYKVVLEQRDVTLRGFRALQALQAREKRITNNPNLLQQELQLTQDLLETSRTERNESLAQQQALRRQLKAADARHDAALEELGTVREELKVACVERDQSRSRRHALQKEVDDGQAELAGVREELTSVRGELDAKIAEGEKYRVELEASRAQLNAVRGQLQTEISARARVPPQSEDLLMNELEASLEAVKQGTSLHQTELARIPELEEHIRTLKIERDELRGWKQEAISLQQEVTEREKEAVEWEQRYEARGGRLTVAIRELSDLRARVGW